MDFRSDIFIFVHQVVIMRFKSGLYDDFYIDLYNILFYK